MQLIFPAIGIIGILAFYSGCIKKEPWETENYELGYDEGYLDGEWDTCKKFSDNLPNGLYDRFKPKYCKDFW